MSYLLVGDNCTNNNWGGRAVSLALRELLADELGPGVSIHGTELALASAGYGYRSRLFPRSKTWLARSLAAGRPAGALLRTYHRLDRLCGAGDFLTDEPAQSVRNLRARMSGDPGLRRLHERIAAAEVVVINGEGDVVLGWPVRRHVQFFAAVAHLARELGKPVAFVNAMLSDCTHTGRDPAAFAMTAAMLHRCDLVAVRDSQSLAMARDEMQAAEASLVPDAVFHWFARQQQIRRGLPDDGDLVIPPPERELYLGRLDFGRPYICVGGNSCAARPERRPRLMAAYADLCAGLGRLGLPVYVVISDGRDAFLEDIARDQGLGVVPVGTPIHLAAAILGRSRLLVSGRYHPTIMAALGGAPSVFLETGAHKMRSLAAMLGMDDAPVFGDAPGAGEIADVVDLAAARLAGRRSLRVQVAAAAMRHAAAVAELGSLVATAAGRPTAMPARMESACE